MNVFCFFFIAKTTHVYCSDVTDFCFFFFVVKTTHLYCYDVTDEVTFWKTFLFTSLNFFPILVYVYATIYSKAYYCCWFEIAVALVVIYYSLMKLLHDVITLW